MPEEQDYSNQHQKEYQDLLIQMVNISAQLAQVVCDLTDVKTTLKTDFVTQSEFTPVRTLVYGAVGLILTAVAGALIALVVTHSP